MYICVYIYWLRGMSKMWAGISKLLRNSLMSFLPQLADVKICTPLLPHVQRI